MEGSGVIVQKFGGTSVADRERRGRVAEIVHRSLSEGMRPVVVVSAPGRLGDAYATDTLLRLIGEEGGSVPARESDLLIACGEIISAVMMAAHLRKLGIAARALTGPQAGIETDGTHGDAKILNVDPDPLLSMIGEGLVPVVAGFQGRTPNGELATLGRGGSDTSAAAIGAALGAQFVDIFTDVDGVKTADPRVVPEARTITELDYDELFQLAEAGAKVVHPRAVEIARQARVPLRVRSTFADDEGTLIGGLRLVDLWQSRRPERSVVGVTDRADIGEVVVETPQGADRAAVEASIFKMLAEQGISADMISVSPGRVGFIVDRAKLQAAGAALQALQLSHTLRDDVAKVAIVGSAIAGLPGVMATLTAGLVGAGVEILSTSDSHSSIACLVPEASRADAVRALHRQFHLS
ncbi:MAG: aspartate kinase [Thermaerobacter sp.]|nr:aspartate kinase [Thermaerobacter sp.]